MNINEYLNKLPSISLKKRSRIVLLIIYALIMFITIQNEINTIIFILLFAVVPAGIYLYVKSIFPKS